MRSYVSPDVYPEDIFIGQPETLATGVPGFAGFADPVKGLDPPPNTPIELRRKEEFDQRFKRRPDTYLADAVMGFFDNGGVRCYVVRADPGQEQERALGDAVESLAPLNDLDLVAVPDAMTLRLLGALETDAIARLQNRVIDHCTRTGDRMALLDPLPNMTADGVLTQLDGLTIDRLGAINAALYYPWLKTVGDRLAPPCGHVAGIYARSDAARGVFKAPANEGVAGILDLETAIDDAAQGQLNPLGVNCLRAFPGRGIRVWGARTLSTDPNWRYVNVRRLFLTLGRWININMSWASFEPNGPELWVRIERELGAYLNGLWDLGALMGQAPEEAFYIKCDGENNPPETRDNGEVITEIGLAPSSPAEFIVVSVTSRAGIAEMV
jgi:hypothetical protein